MVPIAESEQRIARLQHGLAQQGIDGALFAYPVDVYYFAGTRQNAALWVPADGAAILLVRKSYMRARDESLVADVRPFPSGRDLTSFFGQKVRTVGSTFDVIPVKYQQYYAGLLKGKEFVDILGLNRDLRSVKSPWEQEQIRESGRRLSEIFAQVPAFLKLGMREIDLAAELEYHLRKAGCGGCIRTRGFGQEVTGFVAAGRAAARPGCFDGPATGTGFSEAAPYGPSLEIIERGAPIIVDYGSIYNGYIFDMTRIFVIGDLDPALQHAFAVSLEIQAWLVERLKPGTSCDILFAGAATIAERAGLKNNFMGNPGEQAKFVGHGVGLELDELPVLTSGFKQPLREGQTVAIEPKFIFPGKGVVGIENTYVVTPSGGERLTSHPDTLVRL